MAWEKRKGKGKYLYLSRRVDGRVKKKYLGTGSLAQSLFDRLTLARADRYRAAVTARRETERFDQAIVPLLELCDHTELLIKASLLVAGYHNHRGEWRMRRHTSRRTFA